MESSQEGDRAALELYQRAQQLYAELTEAEAAKDVLTAAERGQSLLGTVPIGLYEHWKSCNDPGMTDEVDHWKFYAVRGLNRETFKVEYPALYAPHAGEPYERPLLDPDEGFLAPINRPQWQPKPYVGPRFRLILPLDPQQCELLVREAARIAAYTTRADAYTAILHILSRA